MLGLLLEKSSLPLQAIKKIIAIIIIACGYLSQGQKFKIS